MIVNEAQVTAALPAYELGKVLGRGAFGLVLEGRHRELDRPAAIKILAAGTDAAAASSRAEARLLAALDHPHVVRVYDSIPAGDLHLIVMELLGGGTLTRRRASMSPETACAVGLAVAAALGCAHGRGVLHRDIKPDNILFDTPACSRSPTSASRNSWKGLRPPPARSSAPRGTWPPNSSSPAG